MRFVACLPILVCGALWYAQNPQEKDKSDKGYLLTSRDYQLSPELVVDEKGAVRLAPSVLLSDEIGATDSHQGEKLGRDTSAKKAFELVHDQIKDADLLFFGGAKEVRFNGEVLPVKRLESTGWSRVTVPAKIMRKGTNEAIFSGGGELLVEPSRLPGRSFKSKDGGKTWSNQAVGPKDQGPGEYLIRLRLHQFAAKGEVVSQVMDSVPRLDRQQPPSKLDGDQPPQEQKPSGGHPIALTKIYPPLDHRNEQPQGTVIAVWVRTGSTPTPDTKHWSVWQPLEKELIVPEAQQRHRWLQLKHVLTTDRPDATPVLSKHSYFAAQFTTKAAPPTARYAMKNGGGEVIPVTSVPFVYQEPSPRLKSLRERYKLDEVIAPGKTEMEQLMLLRYWVRNQCHTGWGSHPALWIPPWDAHIILENRDQPDCLVMCTHFSAVFTQCCLALGWNARHCILDHHCVSEVYVGEHDRWVMMDAGNSAERGDTGLHFERKGKPLSALELHLIHRDGKKDGVTVHFTPQCLQEQIARHCRPEPKKQPDRPDVIPLADLPKYSVCQLDNYRRFAFPPRNNFLSTQVPSEPQHGWSEYFYDGYCWVGPSPEYSRTLDPKRVQDINWPLNWCRIHLDYTAKPEDLRIDVETLTPNLLRLEKSSDDGKNWTPTPASFTWRLQPGKNSLSVRSVNHWGKTGTPATVSLTFDAKK